MERLFKAYLFLRVKWRLRNKKQEFGFSEESLVGDQEWPKVTIQLPMYNERNVVERLIRSVAKIDYPLNKLQVQVLDDSTDETSDIVKQVLETLPRNYPIEHIQRKNRTGYKAGALRDGLQTAIGEFVVIFDADFVPEADFVKRIVTPFFSDPKIGVVQGRWGFLNEEESLLTKLQAIAINNHFAYEQFVRYNCGLFLNFNGTCGAWRRACIDDAGGWESDTLAEDLDMSYRAQFKDWKIVYVQDIVCAGELPNSMDALKVQQYRWAKGGIQCFKKHFFKIIKSDRSLFVKIMALIHLSGYTIYIPMYLLSFLPVFIMPFQPTLLHPAIYLAGALGPSLVICLSQISLGLYRNLLYVPLLLCLGYGLMLNNFYAVVDGIMYNHGSFKRTPKQGQGSSLRPYEIKKIPLHELTFLAVSSYCVIWGDNVNSFFYLSHLFYSLCYILMLQFSFFTSTEESTEEKSHSESKFSLKSVGFNTKTFGQVVMFMYMLFLLGRTLDRFPGVVEKIPFYNTDGLVGLSRPDTTIYPHFANWSSDNYLQLHCYRRPAFKESGQASYSKYKHPIQIQGDYVFANCYKEYELLVKNNVNLNVLDRALSTATKVGVDAPNVLFISANTNLGDFKAGFRETSSYLAKSDFFHFRNLKINALDQQGNDLSLASGCGIVNDNEKQVSFLNKDKDTKLLVEYSHDSASAMYCAKFNDKFDENEDIFLWNKFQKNGYVTLYSNEKCPKKTPGSASTYFNKRGGENSDHTFGNYTCGKLPKSATFRRNLYSPSLDYLEQYWNNYKEANRFAILNLNSEAQSEAEVQLGDSNLAEFLSKFAEENENTIIGVVLGADTSSPQLHISISDDFEKKNPEIKSILKSNNDKLITLFDLHTTLASIPYYPKPAPFVPTWSFNLLSQKIPENRNCIEARVSSTLCL